MAESTGFDQWLNRCKWMNIYSKNNEKQYQIKMIGVHGFCLLKAKIAQFPLGFGLNCFNMFNPGCASVFKINLFKQVI